MLHIVTERKKAPPPGREVAGDVSRKIRVEGYQGKRIGYELGMYKSIEGYQNDIAAVISNMVNIAAHGRKVQLVPAADLFSVTLKCHDTECVLYFLSIAHDWMPLSSYGDDEIRKRVQGWADGVVGQD